MSLGSVQVLAKEVKALRKQLDTEKQQAAAREAELAAKEAEHAAAMQAERSTMTAERESWETERAAAQARSDAVREAESAAAAPARPAVAEAAEHDDAEHNAAEHNAAEQTSADSAAAELNAAELISTDSTAAATPMPESDDSILPEAAEKAEHATAAADDEAPYTPASAATAPATAYRQLLQEVAALRQRLHDSSFESVAGNLTACYGHRLLPPVADSLSCGLVGSCKLTLAALVAFLGCNVFVQHC